MTKKTNWREIIQTTLYSRERRLADCWNLNVRFSARDRRELLALANLNEPLGHLAVISALEWKISMIEKPWIDPVQDKQTDEWVFYWFVCDDYALWTEEGRVCA